ncbi:hypothetical protein M9458_056232 [Cirrhinus mrigala]|uniref:Uncharacterized protein n=1 Tax=Cirrhinus mrigala TaxID=683832 RepID=A0ABD0MI44_CIRMR
MMSNDSEVVGENKMEYFAILSTQTMNLQVIRSSDGKLLDQNRYGTVPDPAHISNHHIEVHIWSGAGPVQVQMQKNGSEPVLDHCAKGDRPESVVQIWPRTSNGSVPDLLHFSLGLMGPNFFTTLGSMSQRS